MVITCTVSVPDPLTPPVSVHLHEALTAVPGPFFGLPTVAPNALAISLLVNTLHGSLVAAPPGTAKTPSTSDTTHATKDRRLIMILPSLCADPAPAPGVKSRPR